jgi:hypothetical protein
LSGKEEYVFIFFRKKLNLSVLPISMFAIFSSLPDAWFRETVYMVLQKERKAIDVFYLCSPIPLTVFTAAEFFVGTKTLS